MTLFLASKSAARAAILKGARVDFEAVSAGVDEAPLKAEALARRESPRRIAEILAEAKAVAASRGTPNLVIGADQTLELDGRLFDKAETLAEARDNLLALRGRAHRLHSAVALAHNGRTVWRNVQMASLTMRDFSDAFADRYLAQNAEAVLACVGGYELEGEGVQLFSAIEGDYFTILGLPILPLLTELRRLELVPA